MKTVNLYYSSTKEVNVCLISRLLLFYDHITVYVYCDDEEKFDIYLYVTGSNLSFTVHYV